MRAATYIVAATPRSGSTLLCEGLKATGIAGRPAETFAPAFRQWWQAQWSMSEESTFSEFFRTALAYGTTANGVYGLKIHWGHVPALARQLAVTGRPHRVLRAAFPGAAYVSIVRQDLRAQALSLFRAMVTNEWCRFVGTDAAETAGLTFDRDKVRELESALAAHRAGWERYFESNGIAPLTVEYEVLDADYRGQIARVLRFLGLEVSAALTIPDSPLVRQSDHLTTQWRNAMDETTVVRGRA